MPRKKIVQPVDDNFGERLTALRKVAGLSQRALGAQVGLSRRGKKPRTTVTRPVWLTNDSGWPSALRAR